MGVGVPSRLVKQLLSKQSSIPTHLQVEPTTLCNLRCRICGRKTFTRTEKNMKLEEFRSLIDQTPNLKSINIQGFGEPLLNPRIVEMVEYVKAKTRAFTFFYTNGMLLDPDTSSELVRTGLDRIVFSVDAVRPETVEAIRPGTDIETVRENLGALIEARRISGSPTPEIVIRTTLMRTNLPEVESIVYLAERMQVDRVIFADLEIVEGTPMATEAERCTPEQRREYLNRIGVLSRDAVVSIQSTFLSADPGTSGAEKSSPWCWWLSQGCYIEVDGVASPCCYAPYRRHGVGHEEANVFDRPLSEVWNSGKFQQLRREMAEGSVPEFCRGCSTLRRRKSWYRNITQALLLTD